MLLTYDKLLEVVKEAVTPIRMLPDHVFGMIKEAAKQLNLDDSQSGIYSKLQRALSLKFQAEDTNIWPWIRDVFGDGVSGTIVYSADTKLYSASYKFAGDVATLGTPSRVMMAYVPAKSTVKEALLPNCLENAIEESDGDEISTDLVPIKEAALSTEGKGLLKLIAAGQGSSRFYPKATLQKAADSKVFPSGMQMFMDHQTDAEEKARPEGSLGNLMGVLEADATYQEQGADGPGLYAPVHVYSDYVPFINERASDIGASIRAFGREKKGQVAGVSTSIVEELVGAKSVDFVTRPGAGGKLVPLFESYRAANPGKFKVSTTQQQQQNDAATSRNSNQEHSMTEAEIKALQESVTKLTEAQAATQSENARLQEAAVRSQAGVIVTRKLAATSCTLPDKAKQRIEQFFESAALPKTATKELDKAILESQIDAQIKSEADYLKECSATGVKGLGESAPAPTDPNLDEATKTFNESVSFLAGIPTQKEAK